MGEYPTFVFGEHFGRGVGGHNIDSIETQRRWSLCGGER